MRNGHARAFELGSQMANEQQAEPEVVEVGGVRKVRAWTCSCCALKLSRTQHQRPPSPPRPQAICGHTWPGIEYGQPPTCAYTFFEVRMTRRGWAHTYHTRPSVTHRPNVLPVQYVDTIRFGDLPRFRRLEAACQGWWFPTLDRGAGALLHFAADHGQVAAARLLLDRRGAEVNQRDAGTGWTPLHRCARVAHYRHGPFLELFELLLQAGADPDLRTFPPRDGSGAGATVLELAVHKVGGYSGSALAQGWLLTTKLLNACRVTGGRRGRCAARWPP